MEDKIIWQPESIYDTKGTSFRIRLDKNFALKTLETELTKEEQINLNNKATKKLKPKYLPSLQFHENTLFVSAFHLGEGGIWLGTSRPNKKLLSGEYSEDIFYDTHNLSTESDAYNLFFLFDAWIYNSKNLLKQPSEQTPQHHQNF